MAKLPTEAEIEARVRAAGWEPAEPYPGTATARWTLRCVTCEHIVRRPSTPASVSPCLHPNRRAMAEPWYREWRAQVESGDVRDEERRLKLAGWEPAAPWPTRVADPFRVRCVRCGVERDLVLRDIALAGEMPQCRHPEGEARHLTREERQELRDVRKDSWDETYQAEARAAGWEPAEPRPARETTRWKLRCLTCGEMVLARVSMAEHKAPCPHRLTDAEETARSQFIEAGWEPLERPIRGGMGTQWRIRCVTCGHETRRAKSKRVQPCTHPDRPTEK